MPRDMRLILAHKQSTSARVRFLCFEHGICAFEPLPASSTFDETTTSKVVLHPAACLRAAERRLGLPEGTLKHEPEFSAYVEAEGMLISVNLALFATTDPPFMQAQAIGARFISLTEARNFSDVELDLLRHAYPILV